MQSGHVGYVAFFGFQTLQVQTVRPVNPVQDREDKQRCFPAHNSTDDLQACRERSPHQIVRKRPEVTFAPRLEKWLFLRQTDDRRHRACVRDEVHARGQQQYEWLLDAVACEPRKMIPVGRRAYRDRNTRDVEQYLNGGRPTPGPPHALQHCTGAGDDQAFGQAHRGDGDQNK